MRGAQSEPEWKFPLARRKAVESRDGWSIWFRCARQCAKISCFCLWQPCVQKKASQASEQALNNFFPFSFFFFDFFLCLRSFFSLALHGMWTEKKRTTFFFLLFYWCLTPLAYWMWFCWRRKFNLKIVERFIKRLQLFFFFHNVSTTFCAFIFRLFISWFILQFGRKNSLFRIVVLVLKSIWLRT